MFQSKIAHLGFFSAALLASSIIHGSNTSRVESATARAANVAIDNYRRSPTVAIEPNSVQRLSRSRWMGLQASLASNPQTEIESADAKDNAADNEAEKSSLLRLISLSFFLLFFVPLGVFYPLFLFYRMLLVKPDESKNVDGANDILAREEVDHAISSEPSPASPPSKKKLSRASVSKLQIAFSPTAGELREELSKIGFNSDGNTEYDLVDLMHQTVAVLIEQGCWTHVSCDSTTFSLAKVKQKFDLISQQERKKIAHQQTQAVNHNRDVAEIEGYERSYSYVVVTLIFSTSHGTPLFPTINSKKQLLEELIQLGKMEKETVIKFELLWNPQQREQYINNDQLLTEYGDMTRLL